MYTLGEAAKATGMTKAALSKAIAKGRISAAKDETGRFQIDPSELHRIYPPVNTTPAKSEQQLTQETLAENKELKAKVELLREMLGELKAEREDLRADRDHWRRQATALITHQQQTVPAADGGPKKGFFKRLFSR